MKMYKTKLGRVINFIRNEHKFQVGDKVRVLNLKDNLGTHNWYANYQGQVGIVTTMNYDKKSFVVSVKFSDGSIIDFRSSELEKLSEDDPLKYRSLNTDYLSEERKMKEKEEIEEVENEEYIWTTKSGQKIKVKDMTTRHIINCINFIKADGITYYINLGYCDDGDYETIELADEIESERRKNKWLDIFNQELKRRNAERKKSLNYKN